MFKRKRSFFERLTGSVALNRDYNEPATADPSATTETETQEHNGDWLKESAEEGELAVDVYQTPTDIIIKTMVAGVRPEDLSVNITREMVTIRGQREDLSGANEQDYFQRELYWGSFTKTILLPSEVEAEEAEATEKHGLLTIRLPKLDKDRIQKLKIKSG
ncbi:MAG: Hsp20/alpha crystallin family protein [Patescibacteria group bacterium]